MKSIKKYELNETQLLESAKFQVLDKLLPEKKSKVIINILIFYYNLKIFITGRKGFIVQSICYNVRYN